VKARLLPALALVFLAGCGSSGTHGAITVRTLVYLPPNGGPITGVFHSSEAVVASGTVFDTFKVLSAGTSSSRAAVERTLYAVGGTLKLRIVLTQIHGRASGRWTIQSGTGRWAGLHGRGDYAGRIDFLPRGAEKIKDTMTGSVK
jgi:hypothetical protein